MSAKHLDPVLLVGGSGLVGSVTARTLRRLHPDLKLTIGGRDLARARAVADELGDADAVAIDLGRPDLGLPPDRAFSAVAVFLKDDTLNSLAFAQTRGVPYVEISTGSFEIAPAVGMFIHRPSSAAILLAGSWLVGTASLAAIEFAREFRSVDTIEIAAVLDEQDIGGPAGHIDYERQVQAVKGVQMLVDGAWVWATGELATRKIRAVDGVETTVQAYPLLDPLSLATATDARTIRFDVAVGESASRRRGGPLSTEIVIEIAGTRSDGSPGRVRHEIVHPQGQAPVTAVAVAVAVEHLLGLAGKPPVPPGLYLPHLVVEPETLLRRLAEFGTEFRRA